jgi:hypothetical protein
VIVNVQIATALQADPGTDRAMGVHTLDGVLQIVLRGERSRAW